jgi:ABC-type dipeptide/oligopeptide/nickel transport system permease subunit
MVHRLVAPRLIPLGRRRRAARIRLVVAVSVVAVLIVVPYAFAGFLDPYGTNVQHVLEGPSGQFWFGTDKVGADVFSRTLWAARADLPLALGATAMALAIGAPLGAWFGYSSRWGERAMRVIDAFQALPLLIIILALVALSGGKTYMVAVAIVLYAAPAFIRIVRSEVLAVSTSRYVEAARAFGVSTPTILRRHVLPNVAEIVLAQTALIAASSFLAISALSFLGVGVAPPTPTWGGMVADGVGPLISGIWWPVLFPGAAIFINVVAFNAMANAARELSEARG